MGLPKIGGGKTRPGTARPTLGGKGIKTGARGKGLGKGGARRHRYVFHWRAESNRLISCCWRVRCLNFAVLSLGSRFWISTSTERMRLYESVSLPLPLS